MKIIDEQIRRITITGVPNLDPIRVALEDIGPSQGRINIECYGQSWATYWGGMGKDRSISEFFVDCDEHYIAKKLSNIDSSIFDPDKLKETLQKEVFKERRQRLISKDEARKRLDKIEELNLPEAEEHLWCVAEEMQELMGDEWWYSLPKKANPDYEYLTRIIKTVQEALRTLSMKEAA